MKTSFWLFAVCTVVASAGFIYQWHTGAPTSFVAAIWPITALFLGWAVQK